MAGRFKVALEWGLRGRSDGLRGQNLRSPANQEEDRRATTRLSCILSYLAPRTPLCPSCQLSSFGWEFGNGMPGHQDYVTCFCFNPGLAMALPRLRCTRAIKLDSKFFSVNHETHQGTIVFWQLPSASGAKGLHPPSLTESLQPGALEPRSGTPVQIFELNTRRLYQSYNKLRSERGSPNIWRKIADSHHMYGFYPWKAVGKARPHLAHRFCSKLILTLHAGRLDSTMPNQAPDWLWIEQKRSSIECLNPKTREVMPESGCARPDPCRVTGSGGTGALQWPGRSEMRRDLESQWPTIYGMVVCHIRLLYLAFQVVVLLQLSCILCFGALWPLRGKLCGRVKLLGRSWVTSGIAGLGGEMHMVLLICSAYTRLQAMMQIERF